MGITVVSTDENGTTFEVTLPRHNTSGLAASR